MKYRDSRSRINMPKPQEAKQVVNTIVRSLFLVALVMFATEKEARAYTDPGTGALIWQMMVAGLVGVGFYFRRITTWFKSRKGSKD
ncbi:MAG: hypothetical protein ABI806_22890 [Candidatus Solibacter sp.]